MAKRKRDMLDDVLDKLTENATATDKLQDEFWSLSVGIKQDFPRNSEAGRINCELPSRSYSALNWVSSTSNCLGRSQKSQDN